jgi:heme/copper-type cytochrome/quinol oxidase subunit 3
VGLARPRAPGGAVSDAATDGRSESTVPRTTVQVGDARVARALAGRSGLPQAVWGMLTLIAAETMLLGSFIASYYYFWAHSPDWPPDGIAPPHVAVPLVLAACLAATSVPIQMASRAARSGRADAALRLVVVAGVVQAGYLAFEVHSLAGDLNSFTPQAHAHVFVGLLLSLWLVTKLAGGLTTYRANAAQAIAWYWQAVIVLSLVITGVILSATL